MVVLFNLCILILMVVFFLPILHHYQMFIHVLVVMRIYVLLIIHGKDHKCKFFFLFFFYHQLSCHVSGGMGWDCTSCENMFHIVDIHCVCVVWPPSLPPPPLLPAPLVLPVLVLVLMLFFQTLIVIMKHHIMTC